METKSDALRASGLGQFPTPPAAYGPVGPVVGPGHGQIAGVGRRVGAYLIDGAILVAALIAALIVFGIVAAIAQTGWIVSLAFIPWLVASVVYTPYLESTRGQTLGKRYMHLRVVSEDGGKATTGQCVKRYLGWVVDGMSFIVPLGFIVALLSQRNQRLGDMFAHTLVVNE